MFDPFVGITHFYTHVKGKKKKKVIVLFLCLAGLIEVLCLSFYNGDKGDIWRNAFHSI